MIWASAKAKLYLGLLAVGGVLLAIIKVLTTQNSRLRREIEHKEAVIHHNKVVEKKKNETTIELKSRTADLVNELKEKKTSSELENPNDNW